jgi:hypothetical protein
VSLIPIEDVLAESARAARAAGFSALRLADEMTWVTEIDPRHERLFLRDHDAVALCQYDRRAFQPEVILNVLRTHPTCGIRRPCLDCAFLLRDRKRKVTAPAGPEDVIGRALARIERQLERFLAPGGTR